MNGFTRKKGKRFASALYGGGLLGGVAFLTALGCSMTTDTVPAEPEPSLDEHAQAVLGDNLAGTNLGGVNLGGSNLAGTNLGGPNLGGNNLSANNLGGNNLAGTNLGGNNLAGTNLAGTNLGGNNLAGTNLAGTNLAGTNLAGTNLGGSNLAGTNLAGTNLAGTNLAGTNLAGTNSGANIHNLAVPTNSMLYSGEDRWFPTQAYGTNSSQRIVMGIGSTVFPKLLAEQSANARISVALGKLPWGFANTSGGAKALEAWEAVVWGDQSYNVFVMTAPLGTSWAGVAGFIKGVFRWNAPPTQSMDISGIEASAPYDPTLQTTISMYTGMMGAAAKLNGGKLTARDFVAGELVFVTATTNNYGVQVDFASWVMDRGPTGSRAGAILGNVQTPNAPTRYELAYFALENPTALSDGSKTVSIVAFDPNAADGSVNADSVRMVRNAWGAYAGGCGYTAVPGSYRPVPFRCGPFLDLLSVFGVSAPPNKCDNGIAYHGGGTSFDPATVRTWSTVSGTTAPMSSYMLLPKDANTMMRRMHPISGWGSVLSETYIHLWEPGHALNRAAGTNTLASTRSVYGTLCSGSSAAYAFDNWATGSTASQWCTTGVPSATYYKAAMTVTPTSFVAKRYQITANTTDAAKDPKDWVFQGCSSTCTVGSDVGWVTLDTQTGQTFGGRSFLNNYNLTGNSTPYSGYRLKITKNNGSTIGTALTELFILDG